MGGDEPYRLHMGSDENGVFPAWAGMNRRRWTGETTYKRVPRVGGDEPGTTAESKNHAECSPRGRG